MQKRDELAIKRAEICRGRQHKLVFETLEEVAKPVAEITQNINKKLQNNEKPLAIRETSRTLKWLASKKLAYSPNFESKQGIKGIVYRLTPSGKEIRKFMEKMEDPILQSD